MTPDQPGSGGDFLGALIERARGTAPVLTPRLASRFEPDAVSDAAEAPSALAELIQKPGTPSPDQEPALHVAPRQPERQAAAVTFDASQFSPRASVKEGPASVTLAAVSRAPLAQGLQAAREVVRSVEPFELREAPSASPSLGRAPEPTSARGDSRALAPAIALGDTKQPALAETEGSLVPGLAEPSSEGVLRESREAIRFAKREGAALQTPPVTSEPVVQVSIGRLEIRASEREKRPAKGTASSSAAQAMSLDEYMKQCRRGA
jgi:hypothetical protein